MKQVNKGSITIKVVPSENVLRGVAELENEKTRTIYTPKAFYEKYILPAKKALKARNAK
jgi:hypothetical protein